MTSATRRPLSRRAVRLPAWAAAVAVLLAGAGPAAASEPVDPFAQMYAGEPGAYADPYPEYGAVQVGRADWLGGLGATVFSNGQRRFDGYYQCSELAERLYRERGWPAVRAAANGGAAYIPEGTPGLIRYTPGTGYVPAPGDLVIESTRPTNPYGHVTVVDRVVGRRVYTVEQNGSSTGRHTYTLGPGASLTGGYGEVKAILHPPASGLDSRGSLRTYGDWDGDGTVTAGVAVPGEEGLTWFLTNTLDGQPEDPSGPVDPGFVYGLAGDIPVVGDWDGDGRDGIGVVRRVRGVGLQWMLRNSADAGDPRVTFVQGLEGDQPLVGDWDGDGGDDIGLARRDAVGHLLWSLRASPSPGPMGLPFGYGRGTDYPVVGDWDGDGGDDIAAVRRQSGGGLVWFQRNAANGGTATRAFRYAAGTDYPVAGDWDGNGTETIGVQRPVEGVGVVWFLRNTNSSGNGDLAVVFGDDTTARLG